MRYIFISDVHGQYDLMIDALNKVQFNKEQDTLVSLGDLFDRGPKSKEILEYVMSCPKHICVWGNHDARLKQLCLGQHPDIYDRHNGVPATLRSFCGLEVTPSFYYGFQVFHSDSTLRPIKQLLWQYFDECCWAIEFSDLIGTHAWVPTKIMEMGYNLYQPIYRYGIREDWRTASKEDWYDASWGDTEDMIKSGAYPEKKLIIGHWHAWRLAEMTKPNSRVDRKAFELGEVVSVDCSSFETDKYIAIDGCSNLENGGCVNAYVYETDEQPKLIF